MGNWKSLVASCQAKPSQLTGTEVNKLRFELQYLLSIRQDEKVGCIADLFPIAGYYHRVQSLYTSTTAMLLETIRVQTEIISIYSVCFLPFITCDVITHLWYE